MSTQPRPHDWKEARRRRAWELKQAGWRSQAIATALVVSKGAVSQWLHMVERDGVKALAARPQTGRPPELMAAELQQVPDLLRLGAEAYGFRGEVMISSFHHRLTESVRHAIRAYRRRPAHRTVGSSRA